MTSPKPMGPIERELRSVPEGGSPYYFLHGRAYWAFDSAHEELSVRNFGNPHTVWALCCEESLSEAIEAASELGL